MLRKGAQEYIAFLINTLGDKVNIENVSVEKEYSKIFPNELVSLSPKREIEFRIDLIFRTTPISIISYRMAPAEFKELKLQL